ncbi:hypothetical protein PVAND_015446 [Polypedilum vanderplanki]|uniref:Cuticle protein n=1 Tax=Polypedilum vanderplanki TaxID=319348 RepID=A0A9J6BCM9_POLVA|nr:hypothetical protein PVAND_015446 [Polypedilum vanderplanki]
MNSAIVFFAIVAVALAHDAHHAYEVKVHHVHHPVVHHHAAPVIAHHEAHHDDHHGHDDHHIDYHHHPAYKYEYGVHDPHTKDHKSQWEHRDGDVVKGEYTLDEADGTKRIVKYSSDKHNGFQAHVERIGHAHHEAPVHHHGHHY